MCYYDQYRWDCGDWKWGNFRRHCQVEYRMGETCGMKLVYNTTPTPGKCPLCEKIDRKERRLGKAVEDYKRWAPDPQRQASAAKAREDCIELQREIAALKAERQGRMQNVGNTRRAGPAPQQRYAHA